MDSCNKHDDCIVVYDSSDCPFCSEKSELEDEIKDLKKEIDEKDGEIAALNEQIENS
jgi:hypothetical protein